MTALKINPAKLPDRGAPTKDRQPKPWTIPDDVKVIKVENKTLQTEHEAWKKKQAVHNKRGGKKNNANKWTDEEIEKSTKPWNCTGRALIIPRLRRQWDGRNMRHVG